MNKHERERLTAQENTLCNLGFTPDEANRLRRISLTLRRWHKLECGVNGGCIERDDATGRPYWRSEVSGRRWPVADRERGALLRLARLMRHVNGPEGGAIMHLNYYVQTDPRGAALYILRPGDIPPGTDPASCYTRGICVY
jgi:hypothetical protein